MAPIPARAHIFHWLFESVVPLLAFLENGGRDLGLGLIVNAKRSGIQQTAIDFLKAKYGLETLEPLGAGDAARVPELWAAASVPQAPLGLRPPLGTARLEDFGRFIARDVPEAGTPRRNMPPRNGRASNSVTP